MTIVITMAGQGKRFQEAGYDMPKYQIQVRGKTLFEWSMDSLLGFNDFDVQYIFIIQKRDNAKEFLEEKCHQYNIRKYKVIELIHTTDGQATTCMQAIPYCDRQDSILVYNIDTYVEPYEMNVGSIKGDGFIPCFEAEGTHWSFVETDETGKVVYVKEKERISNNCSVGAYYFKTSELYSSLYKEYYGKRGTEDKGEKYIAPLYNLMIDKGMDVKIQNLDRNKVHVLGTPEELVVFERGDLGAEK